MKLGDAIIAATALEHKVPLVTRNMDDFKHITGLDIVNPFANCDPLIRQMIRSAIALGRRKAAHHA